MNHNVIPRPYVGNASICHRNLIEIDGAADKFQNTWHMKPPERRVAAFSLVEVTIALGVAAICMILLVGLLPAGLKTQQASAQQTIANQIMTVLLSDLRADVRLPPGQASKEGESGFGLHGHWAQVATPDTLWFDQQGKWLQLNGSTPAAATFRAKITHFSPPNTSTSVANIVVSWPAQVDPATGTPAGSAQQFIAVNR
jgi:uncharacterized protein (TIGR02598 family)